MTKPVKYHASSQGALVAVSWGDPAGVGPEVILKSFPRLPKKLRCKLTVFGSLSCFLALERRLKTGVDIVDASKKIGKMFDGLRVADVVDMKFSQKNFGRIDRLFGKAAMTGVEKAVEAVREGRFGALVTAPISKEAVNLAGYRIAGHTEFLSETMGGVEVAMMLSSKKLSVIVATTHVAIRDVPGRLSRKKLAGLFKLIHRSLVKFGVKKPRLAVCGLNPHASDGGLFGDEEKTIIAPAIKAVRSAGVDVSGPYPADTMFTPRAISGYDVAVAMYHDQGLVPVKALSFGKTVNITLGLPFVRVSVDHGTAFDIAGKNRADATSMIHAIKTCDQILNGKFRV
ncbi:4-hydroxythreonine-4-phosphate dehydrogenase [hydrothermal vent metagenome]|uniref:4-hydroxythreonine-4-phosphate dehydrogenase n=1 Tax=hydrothermal vent metagenome TaxID=652676 RepID=A0A3B1C4Z1_9ZZZZ